jgi:tetratricopeptide (TPR) repeat protein
MTQKYDKYKNVVNVPQKTVKRGFDAIKDWTPQNKWWQLVRVPTATVAFNLYLALWLFTKVGLDNPIIEKLDDVHSKKRIKQNPKTKFGRVIAGIKKQEKSYPTLSAIIAYYMLLTMLAGAGQVTIDGRFFEDLKLKREKHDKKSDKININNLKIDPSCSKEDWLKQMDAIWPYLYMETVLSEGFINEAYADVGDSGGYLTIGSGFMIGKANPRGNKDLAIINERKAFFKKVLGKPYVNGVSVSYEENKILIRAFYEKYVWPYMQKSFTKPMDAHLFIELCLANFNRGSGIYQAGYAGEKIKNAVNSGNSDVDIANRFDDFCKDGFSGLLPKYGVAAHRVLGDVSDENVLNSLANSVYKLDKKQIWNNGQLKEFDTIAQVLMGIKNADVYKNGKTYVQYRVSEYLTPWEIENIKKGALFTDASDFFTPVQEKTETTAEILNEEGEALYFSGNYKMAIEKYNSALKQNPDLYVVYSNLSLAYYKLGEYDNALKVVNDFVNSGRFKSTPATVKGYTYYNAALCYEKLGDKESNTKRKLEYYNLAKQNAERGQSVANTTYRGFMKRIDGKISDVGSRSKTVAFNDGIRKVQNRQNDNAIFLSSHEFQA